jgi:hypothetical protein
MGDIAPHAKVRWNGTSSVLCLQGRTTDRALSLA